MNLGNELIRKQHFNQLYRGILKAIAKLKDQQIIKSIKSQTKSVISKNKSAKANSLTFHYQNAQSFLKFLTRCCNKHNNSLIQLIRIYTDTTPLNFQKYMLSRPLIQLQQTKQFANLNQVDKDFVRNMVLKCCKQQQSMYKNLMDYLSDSRSEDFWDWRGIPIELPEHLKQQIKRKVDNSQPYHSQYRHIFKDNIKFRDIGITDIVQDLINSNYWVL